MKNKNNLFEFNRYLYWIVTSGILFTSCNNNPSTSQIDKSAVKKFNLISQVATIGPGTLPDWHAQADVQLGWIFADPTQPHNSSPLSGWDQSVGTIPLWSYDAGRTAFGHPGQWYIRIPNVVNDNAAKKFWISWVYEFDTYLEGERSATNIDWSPDEGAANESHLEEWFDSTGNPTTDYLQAAYARVTHSLDLYPSPDYEDVWLGVFGGVKHALEVYIKSISIPGMATGKITIDIKPGSFPNSINPRNRGVIPVAVITMDEFDVSDLRPSTIVFGPAHAPVDHYAREDVDDDGDIDLILHFRTQKTGIKCGDTEAELRGETVNGEEVSGSDSIRTVGCK